MLQKQKAGAVVTGQPQMASSNGSHHNKSRAAQEFREAIRAAGLQPPDVIEPGRLYRFPGAGKRNGNTAGWCFLFEDGLGGVYGDWASGLSEHWQARRDKPPSTEEREAFARRVAAAKAQAEAAEAARKQEARDHAGLIWNEAIPCETHPYLSAKGVAAHGARLHGENLVLPLRDAEGVLHSLQLIAPNGAKRFLPGGRVQGCYFLIGALDKTICICEGFATGASIHEATGYAVAVAFNAGNLLPVARALRAKHPDARLILCADDDWKTDGNPGLTKAREAALAVGALLAIPDFGADRKPGMTDFNDLHLARGMEAVRACVEAAEIPANAAWPDPQPLTAKFAPEPYPLDALPDRIRAAVEEVQAFVKAPVPLVASSALAALSLACQAHVDVKRAEKLQGPVSLFLLTIADSGERKTTCDWFFTSAIRKYEDEQAEAMAPLIKEFQAKLSAWEAEREAILAAIKTAVKSGKSCAKLKEELLDLEYVRPSPPRVPRMLLGDETPEALAWSLARQWPSAGVLSSEAATILGAHGMGKDSIMRNLGLLNVLWDGGTHSIGRRTTESFVVKGARLTVGLMVQEATLREYFAKSGSLARGSGFLARFLMAWPESTQGQRPFTEAPEHWPALAAFHRRIDEILRQPIPLGEDGQLSQLSQLSLSQEAKLAWIAYHDTIEAELRDGGELHDVRDVAAKSAENAARLAALFHVFEHGIGAISLDSFERASRIAAWHLSESRRFFGEFTLPAELADAARLDTWLIEYCRRERTHMVPTREAQRLGPVRVKERLTTALQELEELDRARVVQDGRRKAIEVNPALLETTP
jgi:putative DNA primase/helicase